MPAFMLHKLLVASLSGRKEKREKDFKQVCAVAKKIITYSKLIDEVHRIFKHMPLSWRKQINTSVMILQEIVEDCRVDFSIILEELK